MCRLVNVILALPLVKFAFVNTMLKFRAKFKGHGNPTRSGVAIRARATRADLRDDPRG
jgi:hypothetical protein